MIAIAHRKGLYTKAFCTTPEEAQKMVDAGCDNVIAHGGNTRGDPLVLRPSFPSMPWWISFEILLIP